MLRRTFLRSLASAPLALLAQAPAIKVTPLGDKLHLLSGAGGNIAILESADGLLLIDSGLGESTEGILAETGKFNKPRITRLINTHWHHDHTGSNTRFGK